MLSETKIKFCKLCLTEKVFLINTLNDGQLLKFINTCRRENKLLLKCLKKNNRRHDSEN